MKNDRRRMADATDDRCGTAIRNPQSEIRNQQLVRHLLAGPPGHVHFIGIGGVGMAGLAFLLRKKGWRVSGCDLQGNNLTAWLTGAGIEVRHGHDAGHLAGVDWVVRTTAVRPDHPEVRAAEARGLPVFQRGVVLAALLADYTALIVCGTHGKTTTTAMLTQILLAAGRDPSYCIGGTPAVAGVGKGDCLVAEADESDGTLSCYRSDIAVVTNIEFDHAEHFADIAALRRCFAAMLANVRRTVVYCADDPEARALCGGMKRSVSYGITMPAEWRAAAVEEKASAAAFQVWCGAEQLGEILLPAPGRHNVLNALAACAAAAACGVGFEAMRQGLQTFRPVRRRFERIIEKDDVLVISDYAHHPAEIAATLRTLPALRRKRWLAVFQPHRYSRTRALAADFAAAFAGVDELILAPVYAASEAMLAGGTAWDLYAHFRSLGRVRTLCAASLSQAWGCLRAALRPGDGLLVLGAGDVEQIAHWARAELTERGAAALDPAHAWAAALGRLPWKSAVFERRAALASRTTLRVGGSADILAGLADEEDLTRLLQWTHTRRAPLTILGAGSNVLVSDLGVRGIVVRLADRAFRQIRVESPSRVVAGAAVSLHELTERLAEEGLGGLEFLAGIPGTVGGALRMNAGAWGESIGARTAWVRCLNPDGSAQVVEEGNLGFGYRRCEGLAGKVALEAAFNVAPSDRSAVRGRMEDIFKKRAWLSARHSAGSVFKNPAGEFAGRLLEQAGLNGRRIGGARVADEHANVIVTEPGACASDVRALLEIMRQAVRRNSGIELEEELVCLE